MEEPLPSRAATKGGRELEATGCRTCLAQELPGNSCLAEKPSGVNIPRVLPRRLQLTTCWGCSREGTGFRKGDPDGPLKLSFRVAPIP